jgi:hypothetical protein
LAPPRLKPGVGSKDEAMDQIPKKIQRALRELADRAYEIDFGGRWPIFAASSTGGNAARSAFDVTEAIHRFHQGPARDLYLTYRAGLWS